MESEFAVQIALSVFTGIVTIFVGWFGIRIKRYEEKNEKEEARRESESTAFRVGLQAVLRDCIFNLYERCNKEGKKKSPYDNLNMEAMYKAYHALGGNGTVTQVYDNFQRFELTGHD
jgi:hypothetical protein